MTLLHLWQSSRVSFFAAFLMLLSLVFPIGTDASGETVYWLARPILLNGLGIALLAAVVGGIRPDRRGIIVGLLVTGAVILGAIAPLGVVDHISDEGGTVGIFGPGLWLFVSGLGFLAWRALSLLSEAASQRDAPRVLGLLVPALFGAWLIYLWQVLVTGFGVPSVLLPAPSLIAQVFAASTDTLWADFIQTFLKAVLAGYALGCGSGFLVALLVDRVPFLQRGLLPLGNFVSALPIVGVAPIMVMWFGFDWQSKAAVVVIMTFFPMLVNTIAGLHATQAMERDLMRSYAASYLQTLLQVRLPNALPFIFNALKINSTLALIGAIVAEFFGTPIVGMGFRISTEIGRMNVEMVWATIVVAAVAGSLFYGLLALAERAATFWHPSYRA
jgi:NitT/TauT family transport system permease protein